jgi:hypothetical protein
MMVPVAGLPRGTFDLLVRTRSISKDSNSIAKRLYVIDNEWVVGLLCCEHHKNLT